MTGTILEILGAVLLVLAALVCWALNVLSLPGNWFVVVLAALYAYLTPSGSRPDMGWTVVVGLLVLAVLGEIVEFAAGALGASQAGGSKRGAALAMVGSLVGGIVGMFSGVAIPIPVVGSVIGALLFASIGALAGAVLGEQWKGRDLDASVRVGQAAFWGRLLGTLSKIVVGAAMIAVIVGAVLL